jgi:hypothetical protein
LEAIRDKVVVPFREAEKEKKIGLSRFLLPLGWSTLIPLLDLDKVPFGLIGKVFLDKKQIQFLFEKHIRTVNGCKQQQQQQQQQQQSNNQQFLSCIIVVFKKNSSLLHG